MAGNRKKVGREGLVHRSIDGNGTDVHSAQGREAAPSPPPPRCLPCHRPFLHRRRRSMYVISDAMAVRFQPPRLPSPSPAFVPAAALVLPCPAASLRALCKTITQNYHYGPPGRGARERAGVFVFVSPPIQTWKEGHLAEAATWKSGNEGTVTRLGGFPRPSHYCNEPGHLGLPQD